jgi:hypothetical protein
MLRRHPPNPGRFTQVRRTAPGGHAHRACALGNVSAPSKAIPQGGCEAIEGHTAKEVSGCGRLRAAWGQSHVGTHPGVLAPQTPIG